MKSYILEQNFPSSKQFWNQILEIRMFLLFCLNIIQNKSFLKQIFAYTLKILILNAEA